MTRADVAVLCSYPFDLGNILVDDAQSFIPELIAA